MQSLTIFYTAALRGRLETLPRLFTFIRRERLGVNGVSILLDLGESCVPDHWLCAATGGRALLVAMDSMGYDAFCLSQTDALYADSVTLGKLRDTILTPIITAEQPLTLTRHYADEPRISLTITCASDSQVVWVNIGSESVELAERWAEPLIGRINVTVGDDNRLITHSMRYALPEAVMPDPTISSVIEFVESEAHYAIRKRQV